MTALRIAAILAATLCAAGEAVAESPACAPLQSNYVALLKASASAGATDTSALRRQLGDLTAQARQGNCNRFLFFGPPKSPECPAITANIAQVQQQLAAASRGGGLFNRSPDDERAFLQDALQQNGCSIPSLSSSGPGRTLCVRTCDGYYFPLNYQVSASRVKKDAATCQTVYGGDAGAASLFVQRGDDVADARSVDGKRYGDQAYAFLYRQTYDPACHALLKDGMTALEAKASAGAPADETPIAISAPDQADEALQAISSVQEPEDPKRRVRFVGSAYYQTLFAYSGE